MIDIKQLYIEYRHNKSLLRMLGIGTLYVLILIGLHVMNANALAALNKHVDLLDWVKENSAHVRSLQDTQENNNTPKKQGTIVDIETTLTQANLHTYITNMNQQGLNEVTISFAKIPFNDFYSWLLTLNQTLRAQIKQLIISNQNDGIIDAEVILALNPKQ